jgi:hypothetical protein
MKAKNELDTTENSTVWAKRHKELEASCPYCKWHRNENASRKPRHGVRKKKTHRNK